MRSLIISSVIGTAALAIHGVAGAALPANGESIADITVHGLC